MIVVLVVTTLANLTVGQMLPRSERPVIVKADGSLAHLVASGQRGIARRYSFFFTLADTGGSRLVVFPGAQLDGELLRAFTGMELEIADYSPTDHRLPNPGDPQGELLTDDGRVLDFWVLPGQLGESYWLAEHEGGYAAVASSLAPRPGSDG